MRFSYKHIGLILGILLVVLSFLFFGRLQDTYFWLLVAGLVIALVSYLLIIFGRESTKSKLLWSVVVVLSAVMQQLTEPVIIATSYRFYINQHKDQLAEVNNILERAIGEVYVLKDTIIHPNDEFTLNQMEKLRKAREKLGAYLILKTDNRVYYCLWGFIDVKLGITYWSEKSHPDSRYRNITGNWFY